MSDDMDREPGERLHLASDRSAEIDAQRWAADVAQALEEAEDDTVCREDVGLLQDVGIFSPSGTLRRPPAKEESSSAHWVDVEDGEPLDIELAEQLVAASTPLQQPVTCEVPRKGLGDAPPVVKTESSAPVAANEQNAPKGFRQQASQETMEHSARGDAEAKEGVNVPASNVEEDPVDYVINLPCATHSSESLQIPHRLRSKSKGSDSCMWNLACMGSACGSSVPASEACDVKPQLARATEADYADPERSWSPLCNSNEPHSPRVLADLKKELEDSIYTFQIVVEKKRNKLGLSYDDSDGKSLVVKNLKPGVLYDSIYQNGAENWVQIEDRIVEINNVTGKAELLEEEIMRADVINITLQRPRLPRGVRVFCADADNPTVTVHAYDLFGHGKGPLSCLSRTLNAMSTRFGLFHTGVEVYGQEWYFGANLEGLFHGVQPMEPKQHPVHRYRCSVVLGKTRVTPEDFEELMPLVRMKWPSWSYTAMSRNCHSFSDFFCQMLGFPSAPKFGLFGSGDEQLCFGPGNGTVADARAMVRSCSMGGCISLRAGEGRGPSSPTQREEVHSTPVVPQLPSSHKEPPLAPDVS